MKNIGGLLIAFSLIYSAYGTEITQPGSTLKGLMLSKTRYDSPQQVRAAFARAERKATNPHERSIIQMLGVMESCIFKPESKANKYADCSVNPDSFPNERNFAAELNRRLKVGPKAIGSAVFCVVGEISRHYNEAKYRECLRKDWTEKTAPK